MAVEVRLIRRLGNNLFQYCLGRIVAEALGYELRCVWAGPPPSASHHQKTSGVWATLPTLARHFPKAPLHVPGKQIFTPHERYVLGERNWSGQGVPLNAILADSSDRRIVLCGFFQRMEYYAPARERIREWLAPVDVDCGIVPEPQDVVLNIRRGLDYFLDDWVLSTDYYVEALEAMRPRPGRVFVCGVGIDDAVRLALKPFGPIYYQGTAIEEYQFIGRFRRIVLSNSTFAWWAAWLSDAAEIVFPRCRGYWGAEFPDVDLEVSEPRYVYKNDVLTEPWRPLLRNKKVPIAVKDENDCVFLRVGASVETCRLSHDARGAVDWIAHHDGAFGPCDLLPFIPMPVDEFDKNDGRRELEQLLAYMVRAGALSGDRLCQEWITRLGAKA